jgi:sugar (glycoside-pentoside-hexuronide) transporter
VVFVRCTAVTASLRRGYRDAPVASAHTRRDETLPTLVKAGYALGDHAVNVQLAATSLFYLYFLTQVAGLRPSLAGLVVLSGRVFDAVTDPAMGRLSDRTRWRAGRRRPFFLIGALPFGATFALLWTPLPIADETARFLAYAGLYVVNTLCSTVVAVPYMALLPEMAASYQERTAANAWRMGGVVAAVLLTAVSVPLLAERLGGGPQGWGRTGAVLGAWVALPWLVVHRVSFERPGFRGGAGSFFDGLLRLARHRAYRRLAAFFLAGRIGLDVVGAMLIFWFTWWIGRPGDLSAGLGVMLGVVAASLPLWLRLSERFDKRALFAVGAAWWVGVQLVLFAIDGDDPRALVFAAVALGGVAYGVCDLVPWSMLGDVVDEDELASGERREGVYAGVFTFLRKLGGASAVAAAGAVLEAAGLEPGRPPGETALTTIRVLTTLVPAGFLLLALGLVGRYPLTRARHAAILAALAARGEPGPQAGPDSSATA